MAPKSRSVPKPQMTWLKYAPTLLAAAALAVSLFYVTTLSTRPNIQIQRSSDQTLVSSVDRYEKEAEAILRRSLLNRSKLTINTDKIAAELHEAFPELGDITVVIPLVDRRPVVQAQPIPPALALSTQKNGVFVIDAKGRAIAKAADVDSSVRDALPLVRDESGLDIEVGSGALPETNVAFIQEIFGQLAGKQIVIESISLPATTNELRVQVRGKPYFVKFDLQGEGRFQAGTYLAVKAKLERDGVTPAEYIDVRVPEKAFYR